MLWPAPTQPALLRQWLVECDFAPEIGRKFQFRNEAVAGWDGVIECKVPVVEPLQRLAYSWRAFGQETTVEFTLTPEEGGTHLRMEHAGFEANREAAFQGAQHGWQRFPGTLERLLGKGEVYDEIESSGRDVLDLDHAVLAGGDLYRVLGVVHSGCGACLRTIRLSCGDPHTSTR